VRPHEYLLVLLRNWLVIVVTVLIGLLVGFGVSRVQPTTYEASADVLFTGHSTTGGQDLAYVGSYTQGRLTTYQRLAKSTSVLTLVKRDLGTAESVNSLRSRISLSTVQATSIVSVRAISATRADAKATAAAVATRLKSSVEDLENGASSKSKATVDATIISKAESSADPVSPNLSLDLLVGALVGLAVSAGVVTVREALRAGRRGATELG
jgi:capsular polysaccharide biosynthesis protein